MDELREVFEMVTKQVDPDQDSWQQQERRQRRSVRRARLGAFAMVVLIALGVGAFVLSQTGTRHGPANVGTSSAVARVRTMQPEIVGPDGEVQDVLSGVPINARSLDVSPDGRTIVFVGYPSDVPKIGERLQIGTVGIDGTGLRFLARVRSLSSTPVWSPDGSRIAFADHQIFVMKADGSGLTQLTSDPGRDQWPTWSPDGSTIAYSNSGTEPLDTSGFSSTQELWTIPASGGTPTRVTHNGVPDDMPSYSPDGTQIAFFRGGGIWLMRTNGADAHRLPGQPKEHSFNPRWSSDGTRIAFITYDPQVRAADGGPLLTTHVADLSSGRIASMPGRVESDIDRVSWLPGGALLVNRYVG